VYRYGGEFDNLEGDESPFGICSFWAVDYLAQAGRIEEATRRFEWLLECANDVGLYGEEVDLVRHFGFVTDWHVIGLSRRGGPVGHLRLSSIRSRPHATDGEGPPASGE
jgi:hypothetical protein